MTKTRILFCDHNMDIAGGQRSVLALIDSIDRSEFDLYAAVPAGATKLIEELGKRSVSVVPLGLKRRDRMRKRHFFRAFDLAGSVWDAGLSAVRIATVCRRRRIDIIHANTIAAALIASLARFFSSFKLAVRIRSGLVYSNHGVLDFFMLSMADVILCNSHYVRGTIATRLAGAPAGFRNKTLAKAYVVYNPLPWPAIKRARRAAARNGKPAALRNGRLNLGVVGRITARKQQHVAVDAVALLAAEGVDAHLWMIGDASPIDGGRYARDVAQRVRDYDLADRVTFTGFVDNVYEWLAGLDIVLMPSIAEPLARTVYEAQAMGAAVIAADDAGNAELITHQVNGLLFAPGDARDLAEQIKTAPAVRAQLEWRALAGVARAFSPQVTVKCEEALLRGSVARGVRVSRFIKRVPVMARRLSRY